LSDVTESWGACYGSQGLVFNLGRLGKDFFEECVAPETRVNGNVVKPGVNVMRPTVRLNQLLIHEIGHHIESNHLDDKYHEALCNLGAKLTRLALTKPELFCREVE
jgi:hypothetical protein